MQCPGCGRTVPDGVKFCAGCGARVEPVAADTCPKCGAPHAPDAKFCKQCGQSFVAAAPPSRDPPPEAPAPVVAPQPPPAPPPAPIEEPSPRDVAPARADVVAPPVAAAAVPEPVATVAAPPQPPPQRPTPPPPPVHAAHVAAARRGVPGWLIGLIVALVVVLAGGAAFAYWKFFRAATGTEAVASATAISAPVPETASAGAPVSSVLGAVASAMEESASPTASAPASATEVASTPPPVPVAPLPQASAATAEASVQQAAAPEAAPPPVDHTLEAAQELVRKGERAYSQGDYESAVRRAHSALDVHAGYAPAERLLKRAYAAQKQVSEQQEREQQQLAAEQQAAEQQAQAAQAEAAAQKAKAPTPDQIYNQRAHSECARGMFGKSCRHKIRVEVCQGATLGTPGTTVCNIKD